MKLFQLANFQLCNELVFSNIKADDDLDKLEDGSTFLFSPDGVYLIWILLPIAAFWLYLP